MSSMSSVRGMFWSSPWAAVTRWRWTLLGASQWILNDTNNGQADSTGLKICTLAGYDPRLATEFLERFAVFEAIDSGHQCVCFGFGDSH